MGIDVYTLGADIGSAASKCVVLKNGTELAASAIESAGAGTGGPARALEGVLAKAGLKREDICAVTATGYGRNSFTGADLIISELSAHAMGAAAFFPGVRTVIDIGGQDAKVLRLTEAGTLDNFVMNDKCAAGTGRFLEVMARILELEVWQMGDMDEKAEKSAGISSTCTVFAESEVISQLAKGTPIPDIVRGIHESAAVRSASLVRRMNLVLPAAITGGVAQNKGMVHALERELGCELMVSPISQLCGAYGAALHAFKKGSAGGNR